MRAVRLGTCVALLACVGVGSAVAQQGGGRFEERVSITPTIGGMTAVEAQAVNDALRRLAAVLRAQPAVNTPPAGICTRLTVHTPAHISGPRIATGASVQVPISLQDGVCHNVSNSGLAVQFNNPFGVLQGRAYGEDSAGIHYVVRRGGSGNMIEFVNWNTRWLVITRGSAPLLLPVTREEYLRHHIAELEVGIDSVRAASARSEAPDVERWLREEKPKQEKEFEQSLRELSQYMPAAELQRMRRNFEEMMKSTEAALRAMAAQQPEFDALGAGAVGKSQELIAELQSRIARMSAAERSRPACMGDEPVLASIRECDGRSPEVVRLNRSYFDAKLPRSAIQLIVVSAPQPLAGKEDPRHGELRMRMFDTVDRAALAALLHR